MREYVVTKYNITIFSYLTKLRQLALVPSILVEGYTVGSGKIDITVELINEFINNKLVIKNNIKELNVDTVIK